MALSFALYCVRLLKRTEWSTKQDDPRSIFDHAKMGMGRSKAGRLIILSKKSWLYTVMDNPDDAYNAQCQLRQEKMVRGVVHIDSL